MYPISSSSEFHNHYRGDDFSQPDIEVLFSENGLRSQFNRTILGSKMTPIYSAGGMSKYVDPGYFHGYDLNEGDNGYVRVLPRAYVQNVNAKTIVVKAAKIFVVGDVLHQLDTDELVGTIANVDPVANILVLSDAPSVPLSPNTRIGVKTIIPVGATVRGIDLVRGMPEQGLYTSASLIKARVPYWDFQLREQFPEIVLV